MTDTTPNRLDLFNALLEEAWMIAATENTVPHGYVDIYLIASIGKHCDKANPGLADRAMKRINEPTSEETIRAVNEAFARAELNLKLNQALRNIGAQP